MYKRYVDDTNMILEGIKPNVEWEEESKKLTTIETTVYDQEVMDVRTVREIRRMANSMTTSIQLEEAVPSKTAQTKNYQC